MHNTERCFEFSTLDSKKIFKNDISRENFRNVRKIWKFLIFILFNFTRLSTVGPLQFATCHTFAFRWSVIRTTYHFDWLRIIDDMMSENPHLPPNIHISWENKSINRWIQITATRHREKRNRWVAIFNRSCWSISYFLLLLLFFLVNCYVFPRKSTGLHQYEMPLTFIDRNTCLYSWCLENLMRPNIWFRKKGEHFQHHWNTK